MTRPGLAPELAEGAASPAAVWLVAPVAVSEPMEVEPVVFEPVAPRRQARPLDKLPKGTDPALILIRGLRVSSLKSVGLNP